MGPGGACSQETIGPKRPERLHQPVTADSPRPHPGGPAKHGNTQKTRPLGPPRLCSQRRCRNPQGTIVAPGRQTPFYTLVSFCVFTILFDASNIR